MFSQFLEILLGSNFIRFAWWNYDYLKKKNVINLFISVGFKYHVDLGLTERVI